MSAVKDIIITRIFDAPRELVWESWTDPDLVRRWWGPRMFTTPYCAMDPREGGKYLYSMRGPDGREYWGTGVYREVFKPERLLMTDSFADEQGNVVPASHYDMPGDWPMELLVTVTFEDLGDGRTGLTLRHAGMPEAGTEQAEAGWNESFDKLEERLKGEALVSHTIFVTDPGTPEMVMKRTFEAPRERVFNTAIDPNLIPEWWGPRSLTTDVDRMETKPGGIYRYVQHDAEGHEFGFHGVYHEIDAPERMVYTFEFEGAPGHVALETVTFEEHDGQTKMTIKDVYQTVEDRDASLQSGMEEGAAEAMDRFAELLYRL